MAKYSPSLRILVVDADSLVRWAVGDALAADAHTIVEACDAAEAIDAVARGPAFDVVFVGPAIDVPAVALLDAIGTMSPATARVVALADHGHASRLQAVRLGVNRILDSPFDMADLRSAVDQANRCRPI